MYGSTVAVMNIGKTLILGARVLGIVHAHDVHDHLVDDLSLVIRLGVEGSGLGEIDIQKRPEARKKCVEKLTIPI